MSNRTETLFQDLLSRRTPDRDLTRRQRLRLKNPVVRVGPDNIFTSHLSKHTIFEPETDRKLRRQGFLFNPIGRTGNARLSESEIAAQEERLGIRLPPPWREVYKHFNGGWAHDLYWGDRDDPRANDIEPIPQLTHEYLALEDVAPLRDLLPNEIGGLDCSALDRQLIAIACADCHAVVLDYRHGEPRVCRAFFSEYDDDPLGRWEQHDRTFWWPDMAVFFRGLYRQDRLA